MRRLRAGSVIHTRVNARSPAEFGAHACGIRRSRAEFAAHAGESGRARAPRAASTRGNGRRRAPKPAVGRVSGRSRSPRATHAGVSCRSLGNSFAIPRPAGPRGRAAPARAEVAVRSWGVSRRPDGGAHPGRRGAAEADPMAARSSSGTVNRRVAPGRSRGAGGARSPSPSERAIRAGPAAIGGRGAPGSSAPVAPPAAGGSSPPDARGGVAAARAARLRGARGPWHTRARRGAQGSGAPIGGGGGRRSHR